MPAPQPNQPIPAPAPDVIRPPAPAEIPAPDIPSGLPEPGPDIVPSPGPSEIPPPGPHEVPPSPRVGLNEGLEHWRVVTGFFVRRVSRSSAAEPMEHAKMSETVGDFVVERMHSWGVRKVFGYPGDGINGALGAPPG